MAVTFSSVITDSATSYSRQTSTNPGWYLIPKRWAISSYAGELVTTRDYNSMLETWVSQPFSAIYSTDTNKLSHSLVIPPNAITTSTKVGEIYFIYEDYYGNEFLFAVAQPDSEVTFIPGTGQGYLFTFSLNNCNVADTFEIKYTFPQDIEDHNQSLKAHANLISKIKGLEVSYDETSETLVFTRSTPGEDS